MRDQRGQVNGEWLVSDPPEKLADFGRRRAAVSGDERRDAHAHEVLCRRKAINRFDVRVHVDETGRENLVVRVDDFARCVRRYVPDANNSAVANADVGTEPGIAAAVDDAGVCNQEIVDGIAGVSARALIGKEKTAERQCNQDQRGRAGE